MPGRALAVLLVGSALVAGCGSELTTVPGQLLDAGPVDVAPVPTGAGLGEACTSDDECAADRCVTHAGGEVCTATCDDEACPDGWHCVPIQDAIGNYAVICVSSWETQCKPCTSTLECMGTLGGVPGTCVRYGDAAAFCGAPCDSDRPCPAGFACTAATAAEGFEGQWCVREAFAECDCIAPWIEEGAATECALTNQWGTCTAPRACTEDGLEPCTAAEPLPETFDDVDNDCDGVVDEDTCACGDGNCEGLCGEDVDTCPCDCGVCGDGICSPCGESPETCPEDCCKKPGHPGSGCGDGFCYGFACGETPDTCAVDCGTACGDGICEQGETPYTCDQDCLTKVCGNGVCEGPDGGPEECPQDCGAFCGNCECEPDKDEVLVNCPIDCGFCGDGVCSVCAVLNEDPDTCPEDCCEPATEYCNGEDDDCDGEIDEVDALGCVDWHVDADEDGVGDPASAQCLCEGVDAWVTTVGGDCDDSDPDVTVGEAERCSGIDDDCDGETDEGFGVGEPCADAPGGPCVEGVVACDGPDATACVDGAPRDADVICEPAACEVGFLLLPSICDGAGGCAAGDLIGCGGFSCASATACAQHCDDDLPCRDGYECVQGSCFAAQEPPCDGDEACLDQDTCTADLCDGAGVCAHLPQACDPDADTDGDGHADGVDTCPETWDPEQLDADEDGLGDACDECTQVAEEESACDELDDDCDGETDEGFGVGESCEPDAGECWEGTTACAGDGTDVVCVPDGFALLGTTCGEASCGDATTQIGGGQCNGLGDCVESPASDCFPYQCVGDAGCASSCADDPTVCADGAFCDGESCALLKPQGSVCGDQGECATGHCVDGFCCSTACDTTCVMCDHPVTPGVCTPVLGAEDPGTCEGDEACNEVGVCTSGVGQPCTGPGDCLDGNCVDETCCESACDGPCERCVDGVCGVVEEGPDPGTCDGTSACGPGGACLLLDGKVCASGDECLSGICTEGVCCDSPCEGACESCITALAAGVCTQVTNASLTGKCDAGAACDGEGVCKPLDGQPCESGGECLSGFCVDGLCCDSACDGTCQACDTFEAPGTCAPVIALPDPGTCEDGATCDDAGACKLLDGEACGPGPVCLSGHCVDGVCCDVACDAACESCALDESVGACAAVTDDVDPGTCEDAAACNAVGACLLLDGELCGTDADCLSGACADGVCCDAPCDGTCQACGGDGVCVTVTDAVDPGTCDGASACGPDGACGLLDGQGCGDPTQCLSGFCSDGVCCDAGCEASCESCVTADVGVCTLVTSAPVPGKCDEGSACDPDGLCKPLDGQPCFTGDECLSGHCADGLCCDTPCDGTCEACDGFDTAGTCSPVEGLPDLGTCDTTAVCDDAAACKLLDGEGCGTGEVCLSGLCVDGLCCATACDAACETCASIDSPGTCAAVTSAVDEDTCGGGFACSDAGVCLAVLGEGCSNGDECLSGHCADSVCCATACEGVCAACDPNGQCVEVTEAPDPGTCDGASACSDGGECKLGDGETCQLGDDCLSEQCIDEICCLSTCGGECQTCGDGGACLTVTDGQDPDTCAGNQACDGTGVCRLLAGEGCTHNQDCLTGLCVDGVCCETPCAGTCEQCGALGQCEVVTDAKDPGTCVGLSSCDATGQCKLLDGKACTEDGSCQSGLCVDGVCCLTACDGPCEVCDSQGDCGPVSSGTDPGTCEAPTHACGDGACLLELGQACGDATGCLSGKCVDGVCCSSTCDGTCRGCAPDGVCKVLTGQPDPGTCEGDFACDGGGSCGLVDGAACEHPSECNSGLCVDDVCCPSACGDTCSTCASGECLPVLDAQDDDTCGGGSACNADGECVLLDGESCTENEACLSQICADGVCCDDTCTGVCEACSADGGCEPVASAVDDDSCSGVLACDAEAECKLILGETCSTDDQCVSGTCADGVCCATTCPGACERCDAGGTTGTCVPVANSQVPGKCDGTNACSASSQCLPLDGESCGGDGDCLSGQCVDGFCCNEICDETCKACNLPGTVGTCAFVIEADDPGTCEGASTCDFDAECKLELGELCGGDDECVSGACADGVCCNNACTAVCRSCDQQDFVGTCKAIVEAPDDDTCPDGLCTAGACKALGGAACDAGEDCVSGVCADGVCCDAPCNGSCEACDIDGQVGTCSAVTGADDPGTCEGTSSCNGSGVCVGLGGVGCVLDGDCLTELCADGVCCDTACEGTCEACGLPATNGTCSPVLNADDADTCAGTSTCDGAGACKLLQGQLCSTSGECLSGPCVDARCCEEDCDGVCETCAASGLEGSCVAVQSAQDSDTCSGSETCDANGVCVKLAGEPCSDASQCLSSICVDDVCCTSACGGVCETCGGTPAGTPAGTCDEVASGPDAGTCDGSSVCDAGVCKLLDGQGCIGPSQCLSGQCVDGTCCDSACDGVCRTCASGACSPVTSGVDDDTCTGASMCNAQGECKLIDGEICFADDACLSNQCADDVCCDEACDGSCRACDLVGTVGQCDFVEGAPDPDTCGGTMACDHASICKLVVGQSCDDGIECLSGFCIDGFCCQSTCDADCESCNQSGFEGQCREVASADDPDTCPTAVSTCDASGTCKLLDGQQCSLPSECLGGRCADSVCCDETCGGSCEACDLAGSAGTCSPVTSTQDPDSCTGTQVCDDAGVCKLADGQTCGADEACASDNCTDGVCCASPCNGECQACDLDGSVGTCAAVTEATDEDSCVGTNVCDAGGDCVGSYGSDCSALGEAACGVGACVDGVCCDTACDGTCEACDISGSEGTCTTVAYGTDPGTCDDTGTLCSADGECLLDSDAPCFYGSQCAAGFCVNEHCCAAPKDGWSQCDQNVVVQLAPELAWAQVDGKNKDWANANGYCDGLSTGGLTWRLPTVDELIAVIEGCTTPETCAVTDPDCLFDGCATFGCDGCGVSDAGCYQPSAVFPGGCTARYWSSSPVTNVEETSWAVDYEEGDVDAVGDELSAMNVRCVSEGL